MDRRHVDIGGCSLEAAVGGDGPTTVVFENGLATPLEEWDAVAHAVARRARTICYNRRPARPVGALAARSAMHMAEDLEQLLAAVGAAPPYVLVGHSWGGVVVRLFARAHPTRVAGLVLADATHEVIDSRTFALLPVMYALMNVAAGFESGRGWLLRQLCPAAASPAYRVHLERSLHDRARWSLAVRTARAEGAGIRASLDFVRRECPHLPPIPIHVLTAGGATGVNASVARKVHDAWRDAVARAPAATHTHIPTSGHALPIEAPGHVIAAIFSVLDSVRADSAGPFSPN
jgi:pimeloyl-ACP methyl ester carboxylesterase